MTIPSHQRETLGVASGAGILLWTLMIACGPGTTPTEDGSGGGPLGTSFASSPDMGMPDAHFECPGARWYEGSLVIDDSVDVDSLRDIGGVTMDLEVRDTTTLTDLEFLSCLQEVGRSVFIGDNVALRNVHGLERLSVVGRPHDNGVDYTGGLSLVRNEALEHIYELESLVLIGSIWVSWNPHLVDIGLPALRRIRVLELGFCLDGSNALLSQIGGYPSLDQLGEIRLSGQGISSLASLVELAERGVEFEAASFERNFLLSTAEVEAFADAANIAVETCELMDDEEACEQCLSD